MVCPNPRALLQDSFATPRWKNAFQFPAQNKHKSLLRPQAMVMGCLKPQRFCLPPSPIFAFHDTVTDPAYEEISLVSVPRRNSAFFLSLGSRRAGREPCRDLSGCPGSASSSCTSSFAPTEHQTQREGCKRGV